MGVFRYRGRRAGQAVAGSLEAASAEAVAGHLAELGITPIEIAASREDEDVLALLRTRLGKGRASSDDLVMFARQMHTMTRSGIPLVRSLRGIAQVTHSERLSEALEAVVQQLEAGHTLPQALQRHPDLFSKLFVSTVRMGEETGRLEEAFEQLATHLEADRETRRRVRAATRYPVVVVVAIAVAIGILNVFALPVFADIFSEFGAELPWATRVLIETSELTREHWPVGLGLLALAFLGTRALLRTPRGRLAWDRLRLRLPVLGPILEKATLARFSRTFALSLRSGVPVLHALDLAAEVVDNDYVARRLEALRSQVERGDTLTNAAATSTLFTPLVLQMISVGEESGSLDELLHEVGEFYERDVDYELKRLSESLEPILLVAVGILVLILALGIYLPMWDLARAARGG